MKNGSGLLFSLYSEIIVERIEGGEFSSFSMHINTNGSMLYNAADADRKISQQLSKYKVQLENISTLEGSGIRISHIKNLRLQIGSIPFVRSGCADMKIENSLCRAEMRGITIINSPDENCLMHAISCSRSYSEEKLNSIQKVISKCDKKCTIENHCSTCLKKHEALFSALKRSPETWMKYNKLDPVSAPSSLSDVFRIEEREPGLKFHVFEIVGELCRKIYSSNMLNKDTKENIYLLRMQVINTNGDIASHWAPITDIDKFLAKMYYGGKNRCMFSKTKACPYCLQSFFPSTQSESQVTLRDVANEIKKNQKDKNIAYLNHIEHCKCDSLSNITYPNEKNLSFSKYKALTEPKISLYADIETAHSKIRGKICNVCFAAYNQCVDETKRGKIVDFCIKSKHQDMNITECDTCFKTYLTVSSEIRKTCDSLQHEKIKYYRDENKAKEIDYILCKSCNKSAIQQSLCSCSSLHTCEEECKTRAVCDHKTVRVLSSLTPISVGLIGIKNFPDYDKSYKKTTTEILKSSPEREIFINKIFTGEDCVKNFYRYLKQNSERFLDIVNPEEPCPAFKAPDEIELFDKQKSCGYCSKTFTKKNPKVFDHSHLTGRFRTASCQTCNINVQEESHINIYFHNLENFDSHILLSHFSEPEHDDFRNFKFSVIPTNSQKIKGFSYGPYKFKDSCLFLKSSLDENVKMTKDSRHSKGERMRILKKHSLCFKNGEFSNVRYNLLTSKGAIPYEKITSFDMLSSEGFPEYEDFYSSLKGQNIDLETYNKSKQIYKEFECQNLLDLLKIYQMSDVVLLADVFSEFKNLCKSEFSLWPDSFWTLPSYSYNAWLYSVQNEEISHVKDNDMRQFLMQSMRGGLCSTGFARICFATGIKKHIPLLRRKMTAFKKKFATKTDNLDEEEEKIWSAIDEMMQRENMNMETFLFYLDANNLYGSAQTLNLPKNSFKWAMQEEINFLVKFYQSRKFESGQKLEDFSVFEEKTGFFIQCELEYPKALHNYHSDLPLAPSKVEIERENLSQAQSSLLKNHNSPNRYKSTKLIASLNAKESYTVHYRLLETYLKLGKASLKIGGISRECSLWEK